MRHAIREALLDAIWSPKLPVGMQVMVVLDGAQDDVIYAMIRDAFQDKFCLLGGNLAWPLPQTAPYLVHLERDDRLTRFILEKGWGRNWGFFLRTGATLKSVRHHLRHFLLVRDEKSRRLLFRFYDPRVLRVYLPLCRRAELQTFLGPSWDYLLESEDGERLEQFRILNEGRCGRESFDPQRGSACEFLCPASARTGDYVAPR